MNVTKRDRIPDGTHSDYIDIWDGDGFQINRTSRETETPFILLDTEMPHNVPASAVLGSFRTLEEACAKADELGKQDWSEWVSHFGDD